MRTLARPLGGLLTRALPRDESFDAIVRCRSTGGAACNSFNQAELLARGFRGARVPVARALRRVQATPTQAGLSNSARAQRSRRLRLAQRGRTRTS